MKMKVVIDEIDLVANHAKVDMSKVNIVKMNGKPFVSIYHVLHIINQIGDNTCITFGPMTYGDGKGELRNRILALIGDKQE